MSTKATTIEYTRWQGVDVNRNNDRIAEAQERLKQERQAPASESTIGGGLAFTIGTGEAARIMHDLGVANCAQSLAFINRILELEKSLAVYELLLADLGLKVERLEARLPKQ